MSTRGRVTVVALAVAVAVAGFVIASSGGDGNEDSGKKVTTGPVHIVAKGGKTVGGVRDITVNKGNPVRFSVTSDVADEVHVHGYDFHKDVAKGGTVSFAFPAKVDGDFVIELESRSEQIAALRVEP